MNFLEAIKDVNINTDEEDDEYVPVAKEEKEYEKEKFGDNHRNKKLKINKKERASVWQIWNELQAEELNIRTSEDQKLKKNYTFEEISKIANDVINQANQNQIRKVMFAGKEFIVDNNGNIQATDTKVDILDNHAEVKESNQQGQKSQGNEGSTIEETDIISPSKNALPVQELKQKFVYVRNLMDKIQQKTKAINALSKAKYDWKSYAKKEKIENKLEQNRKAGYLEKQKFLAISKELSKQHRKQIQAPPTSNSVD